MGLGTLFIGYFLVLNITYFGYTDLIAGLIMLMGLYKLSPVHKDFKYAFYSVAAFSVFGALELIISMISVFSPSFKEDSLLQYITPLRYVIIALFTALILRAIRDVAREVRLKPLAEKANLYYYISIVAFLLTAVFDLPLFGFMGAKALAIISLILLLSIFVITCINLTIIYKAYMRICMPGEKTYTEPKKSKFEFVNKFREHETQKQKEYAEYKLSKMANQGKKKKKKGKKK